jgi:hypothetical protein
MSATLLDLASLSTAVATCHKISLDNHALNRPALFSHKFTHALQCIQKVFELYPYVSHSCIPEFIFVS